MKHLQSLHWLFPTEENKFAKPVRKEPQSADARTSTFNQLRIRHRAGLPAGFMQYSAPWKGATLPASKRIQLRCWLWSVWNESTINFLKERWGSSCHACSAGDVVVRLTKDTFCRYLAIYFIKKSEKTSHSSPSGWDIRCIFWVYSLNKV